jgi:LysR family transcriptional regulator, hydrogen peroxide-inducible genes activator
MVANGLGMTFLPEISLAHEAVRGRFKVVRFAAPEPKRVLGLAWRKSASRKRDFVELGKLINEALTPCAGGRDSQAAARSRMRSRSATKSR